MIASRWAAPLRLRPAPNSGPPRRGVRIGAALQARPTVHPARPSAIHLDSRAESFSAERVFARSPAVRAPPSTTVEFRRRLRTGVAASDRLSLQPDGPDARATTRRDARARRRLRVVGG